MVLMTKMFDGKSVYECSVDKSHIVKGEAGQKVICQKCQVEMVEVRKGTITKDGKN